jgi:hypothetical protein
MTFEVETPTVAYGQLDLLLSVGHRDSFSLPMRTKQALQIPHADGAVILTTAEGQCWKNIFV